MSRSAASTSLINRAWRLGVSDSMDARAAKRIILSNRMAITISVLSLFLIPLFVAVGAQQVARITVAVTLLYVTVPVLNAIGHTRASRVLHVVGANLAVLLFSLYFGKDSGFYFHLFSCLLIALLITGKEEKAMLVAFLAVSAACVTLLAVADLLGVDGHPLSPAAEKKVFLINVLLALGLNAARIYHFFEETQQTENALRVAVQAAQEADKAKSEFLARMSHEIRTPLSGIMGLAELLEKRGHPDEQRESVQSIRTSANDLLDIINEILDLSKIESGKMRIERVDFDLVEITESVRSALSPLAKRKKLEFRFEMGERIPQRLSGDPLRLKQVLNNLLYNAIKFTETGGVTLRIRAEPPPREGAVFLRFEVEDSGIGIADDAKARIFQAFSQAEAGTTRKFGGTGLGLHICKQIVERIGGEIGFRSEPGKGSCFYFTAVFDIASSTGKQESGTRLSAQSTPLEVANLPAPRVLIVEDEPVNRRVLRGMLALHGWRPDSAKNAREALEACARTSYDLVLMDAHMPGMDGYECTRLLRAKSNESSRQVIIGVTADAMQGSRERCLEAGMDDMITKPILEKDLRRVLARWPARKAAILRLEDTPSSEPGDVLSQEWVDGRLLEQMNAWISRYNPSFWIKSLHQFDASYRRLTSDISAACSENRFGDAGEAAHALREICQEMGFRRMGEICYSLEAQGLGGASPRWPMLLAELDAARLPTLVEWRRWVSSSRHDDLIVPSLVGHRAPVAAAESGSDG